MQADNQGEYFNGGLMSDISGFAPDKEKGTSYQQPFSPVQDKTSGISGNTLGMKSLGPNFSDWNRKANTNNEQVVPAKTTVGSGDFVVTDMLKSAQQIHEQGQESKDMDTTK